MVGKKLEKKMPKTYKGKSTAKGMGGHFAMMKDAIMKTGKSPEAAAAITASAGIKKYGQKEMTRMAAAGKKRASKSASAKKGKK